VLVEFSPTNGVIMAFDNCDRFQQTIFGNRMHLKIIMKRKTYVGMSAEQN
jgi:hypothetical protein